MKKFSTGISIGAAVTLVLLAGISAASAALTFSGTSITGDSNSVIDATGTISIGTNSATGIKIGQSGQTVLFPGNVSSTNLFTGNATTTNLAITALGTSASNCLTVNAAGKVATTTCGGGGSTSFLSATSTGILYNAMNAAAAGAGIDITTGNSIDANGGQGTVQYGIDAQGDSLMLNGQGANPQFVSLVNTASDDLATLNNYGGGGADAADLSYRVFLDENPGDTGNPVGMLQIGTNNAKNNNFGLADQQNYQGQLAAASTWWGLSSTDKILASTSSVSQTGTWATDTTFTNANGEQSATNGSTLLVTNTVGPSGVFYVWYLTYSSGVGAFTVSVDGTPVTNTWNGLSTIANQYTSDVAPANVGSVVGIPYVARYVTTPGSHTITITVTSATGGTNKVTIIGFGFPRSSRYRATSGPKIAIGGVPYQALNAVGTSTAAYNLWNEQVAQQDINDGLNTPFVNIRAALDYNCDFNASSTGTCPASSGPGLHWNQPAAYRVAGLYEAALNLQQPPMSGNPTFSSISVNGNIGINGSANVIYGASNSGTFGITNGGAVLTYNVTNGIPIFTIFEKNASSTGDFLDFQNSGGIIGGFTTNGIPRKQVGAAIASASTINPVSPIVHITGTSAISTVTPPAGCTTSGIGCEIILIPDGLWSTLTGGNIAATTTAIVNKSVIMTYDPATSKWYPSY